MFYMGILSPAFRKKKEGQNALFASAVSQVPLTQNNMPQQDIWGWRALNPSKGELGVSVQWLQSFSQDENGWW